jgi:hypothetical protein
LLSPQQQQQPQPQAQASRSAIFDRKIEQATAGLPASCTKVLRLLPENNAMTIIDFIAAIRVESNPSDHYRRDLIEVLSIFSRFTENKPFKNMIRSDIVSFLESFRKTEAADPMHKWIGIYNIFRIHLTRFFKWLYYPDIESRSRPKPPN